ncbi:MAG: family 43 glycosylhydrolase [Clostridia bacterium]|nr:family 43 glycosylhydrolase [Clostridia bacterium]
MKNKKLFLAFILILSIFAMTVAAGAEDVSFTPGTDAVYFVDNTNGADTNAGTSADAALKTLSKANAYLRKVGGGTIVVSGSVAVSSSYAPADIGGTVVYTSVYGGVDYRKTNSAKMVIGAGMAFSNDTFFENINLSMTASGVAISGRCHNFGFGYDVNVTNDSGLDTFNYPVLIAGWNNPGTLSGSSLSDDYSIHVYSGTWYGIYGGHRRTSSSNPVSNLSGDVSVIIKGGTFENYVTATGMNVHTGRVYMEISGGTFNGAVLGIRRLGTMPSDTSYITDADFTANVLIRITGGTFNARFRLAESSVETTALTKMPLGDATVVVTGGKFNSDFVGYGVVGSVLLKYDPDVLSSDIIKGFPLKSEVTSTSSAAEESASFANPIGTLADPYVIEKDGLYYYCYSSGTTIDGVSYAGVKIAVHENLPFGELSTQRRQVFNASMTDIEGAQHDYWAPELHYFDADTVGKDNAGWYIYVAADDGANANHRMYVLRATEPENALSDYEMVGKISDSTNKWAIDGTVMVLDGKLYFVWSGWEGDTDVRQDIYIAQMSNPYTISSERVLLSKPEYDWETHDTPDVNEGPQVLTAPDGTTHIIYSASGSWTQYYCYGALTLTGTNPLSADSWYKSPTSLFSSGNGIYGTGHGSFVQDEDGAWWMYYHANSSTEVPEGSTWWAERSTYLKPFSFTTKSVNGVSVSYPSFGTPIALDELQTISVDTADYHASGEHLYSVYYTYTNGEVTEVARQCLICGAYDVKSVTFAKTPAFTLTSATDSVTLKWSKIDGTHGYRVYYKEPSGNEYTRLTELHDTDTVSYTHSKLESGSFHRYIMHAYYIDRAGAYQYVATGGQGVYTYPAAPTLTATANDDGTVTLVAAVTGGADSYEYSRTADGTVWDVIAADADSEYTDTTAESSTEYTYRVRALAGTLYGEYSASATVTTAKAAYKFEISTCGNIYDNVSARAGEDISFNLLVRVADSVGSQILLPADTDTKKLYFYTVHGDYIVPAEELSVTDSGEYILTAAYENADAIIFADAELILYGDANGDGKISLVDVIRTIKHIAGNTVEIDKAAADISNDCSITTLDLLRIIKEIVN